MSSLVVFRHTCYLFSAVDFGDSKSLVLVCAYCTDIQPRCYVVAIFLFFVFCKSTNDELQFLLCTSSLSMQSLPSRTAFVPGITDAGLTIFEQHKRWQRGQFESRAATRSRSRDAASNKRDAYFLRLSIYLFTMVYLFAMAYLFSFHPFSGRHQ